MFIGWLGALLFITSYLLLSLDKLSAKKKTYHILNILGAVCLIINGVLFNDLPNIIINIIWALIAAFTIAKMVK